MAVKLEKQKIWFLLVFICLCLLFWYLWFIYFMYSSDSAVLHMIEYTTLHTHTLTNTQCICSHESYENSPIVFHYIRDDQMFPIGISFFVLSFTHTHTHTHTHTEAYFTFIKVWLQFFETFTAWSCIIYWPRRVLYEGEQESRTTLFCACSVCVGCRIQTVGGGGGS